MKVKNRKQTLSVLLVVILSMGWIQPIPAEAAGVTLNASPQGNQNYINLKWNRPANDQSYTYKIYQKKPEATEFQSIPSKATVKVLNLFPNTGDPTTFTNYNGETFTYPKAASLKMWMEQPNGEHAKGYGKGLISVDPVRLDVFGQNPNSYLKNLDGTWKYDAVFVGSWDCNGACGVNGDVSIAGRDALIPFIENGRGFLLGHDTSHSSHPNLRSLRGYLNMKDTSVDGITSTQYGGNKISIKKKGSLINYPWVIGETGTVLTIPYAHTSGQVPYGDIWMQFGEGVTSGDEITNSNGTGYANFYLTTWNNTAMIQTGHSGGQATADEQKVLANTLFYLSQITESTTWDDRSGQDLASPNPPTTASVEVKNSNVTVMIPTATDNGSEYEYYVEATGTNGNKDISNTVSSTIVSGIKGYSIVIDQNQNTIPDNIVETTGAQYQVNTNLKGRFYVHISSVDNADNKSTPIHVLYNEYAPPSTTTSVSTTKLTNGDVQIQVTGSDASMGVKRMKKVNINQYGLTGRYYTHTTTNVSPPVTTNDLVLERIDPLIDFSWKLSSPNPLLPVEFFTVEWDGLVLAPVTGRYTFETQTDDGSQLFVNGKSVINAWVQGAGTKNGTIDLEAGKWYSIKFRFYENTGNATARLLWNYGETSGFQVIPTENLSVIDETGWTSGDSLSYTATANGTYVFVAEDYFGNLHASTVIVNNIDKTPPSKPTITIDGDKIVVVGEEGGKILFNINNKGWVENMNLNNFIDGHYEIDIKVVDKAGNQSEVIHIVKDVYKEHLADTEYLFRYAEIYKRDPYLKNVQESILNLPDSAPEKLTLTTRYNNLMTQIVEGDFIKSYKSALVLLEKAENFKRDPYISNASKAINGLPNRPEKVELLNRLDNISKKLEQEAEIKAMAKAVDFVGKAEKYKNASYVKKAKEYVAVLKESPEKNVLLKRIQVVEAAMKK
jgi:hypothetical protein